MAATAKEKRAKALGYSTKPLVLDPLGSAKKVVFEGEEYFVKPITVAQRGRILKAAGFDTQNPGALDLARLQTTAVIELVVDDSGKRVFEDGDLEALLESPCGGVIDVLGPLAMEQLNVTVEAAAKN